MRTKLFAICAAVALLAVGGGVLAFATGKAKPETRTEVSCCQDGRSCAKAPAAKGFVCCDICPECCADCTEDQCSDECIACCIALGCDCDCLPSPSAAKAATAKKAVCGDGFCEDGCK